MFDSCFLILLNNFTKCLWFRSRIRCVSLEAGPLKSDNSSFRVCFDSLSESEEEFEDEEVEDFRFLFDFFFASFFDFCCLTAFLGDFDRDGFELERDRRSCLTILECI